MSHWREAGGTRTGALKLVLEDLRCSRDVVAGAGVSSHAIHRQRVGGRVAVQAVRAAFIASTAVPGIAAGRTQRADLKTSLPPGESRARLPRAAPKPAN